MNYLSQFDQFDQLQFMKKESFATQITKTQRKFTKPCSISQGLKCSICFQVFFLPTRLFCGHTFCFECVNACSKTKPICPICRAPISAENAGKDLLAYNLINEMEVFCIHDDCSWKGQLQMLDLHLAVQCLLNTESEKKRHKAKDAYDGKFMVFKEEVDEEIEQKINNNISKGCLISRAIMKDDSLKMGNKFDVARKMLRTETEPIMKPVNKGQKKAAKVEQQLNGTIQERKQDNDQNLDFLMELYD